MEGGGERKGENVERVIGEENIFFSYSQKKND